MKRLLLLTVAMMTILLFVKTARANTTDVYTDPIEPTNIDVITIVVSGVEGSGAVLITDSDFQMEGTSLELNISLDVGIFAVVTPWSHSEIIGTLPVDDYELAVHAYYSGAFTGTDTYVTSFTVTPEPATYYVDALNGDDNNDGLSPETAFATIQAAIDDSNAGDEIKVAAGTYVENINFNGKNITLRSTDPNEPNVVADTIIDGGQNGSVVTFNSGEDANCALNGFTITGGYARGGSGIYCEQSSPTINNCIISNNWGRGGSGGGMYSNFSMLLRVHNCLFVGNFADKGGGMANEGSNLEVVNCEFRDNAASSGGGIANDGSNLEVINCKFRDNAAYAGGGMRSVDSNSTLTNCIFSGNFAEYGGGMYNNGSDAILIYCIFSDNLYSTEGSGMFNYESNLTLTNCSISGNKAYVGGGIILYGSEGNESEIIDCNFSGNKAFYSLCGSGGGAIRNSGVLLRVHNSLFTGNRAPYGGAGMSNRGNSTLTNCTFSDDNSSGDGIWNWGSLKLINCILWGDTPNEIIAVYGPTPVVTYSNIQGGWPGIGNIDLDPCFVEPGYWVDENDPNIIVEPNDPNAIWIDGDYHLLVGSPCIDAANDANVYTDIEGNIRPFDFPGVDNNGELPEFDMGAYEATAEEAELMILPRVINRRSRQRRILAWLRLPEGITRDQTDSNEPLLLYPDVPEANGIEAIHQYIFQNRRRRSQRTSILAFFDKDELMNAVGDDGRVELQVVGNLRTGQYFYGTDTVWITDWRRLRFLRHW